MLLSYHAVELLSYSAIKLLSNYAMKRLSNEEIELLAKSQVFPELKTPLINENSSSFVPCSLLAVLLTGLVILQTRWYCTQYHKLNTIPNTGQNQYHTVIFIIQPIFSELSNTFRLLFLPQPFKPEMERGKDHPEKFLTLFLIRAQRAQARRAQSRQAQLAQGKTRLNTCFQYCARL